GIRANSLFHDAPEWLARNRAPDGALLNPPSVLDYPCASHWKETGGQTIPASTVGNLMRQSAVLGDIEITTQDWVLHHLTLKRIQRNDRLITAYHAHDYFFNATDFPDLSVYRDAVLENILTLTDNAEPQRYYQFAFFASDPESPVSQAAAPKLKRRIFGSLA